ncbi:hypothetical protein WV31_07470 [Magnetospirillum sp. ME-1]|uniref:hypothetical protein n=1 Tax=Magnetospirillum sp. ME-1 TaxID=1639348 RepID=UPI000A17F1A3|nr:hypothetical protein [Magnetospirillum sp. ME-1]ARJ65503.1 hypothetical protein WV31_07470 [Magnetospirillum sp. ME-1]
MRGISHAGLVIVVTPPLWLGSPIARPLGDAYIDVLWAFDLSGHWPLIEHYDFRKGAHRGLTLERPLRRSREQSASIAADLRSIATSYPSEADADKSRGVRDWLTRFADRLQAEADFSAERSAWLLRSA